MKKEAYIKQEKVVINNFQSIVSDNTERNQTFAKIRNFLTAPYIPWLSVVSISSDVLFTDVIAVKYIHCRVCNPKS